MTTVTLLHNLWSKAVTNVLHPIKYKLPRHVFRITKPLSNIINSYKDHQTEILLLWQVALDFLLIAIANPSLQNPGPSTSLSVVYHNINGFIPISSLGTSNPLLNVTKTIEFQTHIYHEKPDVVILNETWLTPAINDSEILNTDSYKIFRLDRSPKTHPPAPNNPLKFRKNGGGVFIAIREDLDVECKVINIKCSAEILSLELTFPNKHKIIISTFYRVGTLGLDNFTNIEAYLQKVCKRRGVNGFYLLGDMNLNKSSWEHMTSTCSVQQSFLSLFDNLGLSQLIKEPTHEKGKTLDLLLTDRTDNITDISIKKDSDGLGKSDHFPISFKLRASVNRKKPCKRKIFNFKKANWEKLNEDFTKVNWDAIIITRDLDLSWANFKKLFHNYSNLRIPKVTVKSKFQPPWFDSELYQLCLDKERLRTKYKSSKSDIDYMKYSNCRKNFKRTAQQKMRDNFKDDSDPCLINKKFWAHVKSSTNCNRIPENVYYNDCHRKNRSEQAELFNKFFADQFSDKSTYNIQLDNLNDSSNNIVFDVNQVALLLRNINPNKAQGPDGIHGRILKKCAATLAYPLSKLFKLSYFSGAIPDDWKLANVVPIHKKGSKNNIENYRPISLTSIVMKQFEKIVRQKLMEKCESLINPNQHGFLPKKSCTTQLVTFTDSLALSLNSNYRVDTIYFDFMKAFDSVNHDLLLQKLKQSFKVDGILLRFIVNYLKGRKQSVVISDATSNSIDVNSGVPQGSIVGPLLFVLFINDIDVGLSDDTNITLYADDTKIWRIIKTYDDHVKLQQDINLLQDWATRNKMKFHPDKCHVLPVSRSKFPLPEQRFTYTLNGETLLYYESEKDLGVMVNCKLNWTEHCSKLYSAASARLYLNMRTCHFVHNKRQKRVLYLTMVRSLFQHCSIVWRPHTETNKSKFESIQKRSIKWILNEPNESYSKYVYVLKCKQLDILPINHRFLFTDLLTFYRIFYEHSPIKFPSYLQRYGGNSRLRSCHLDHLSIISTVSPSTLIKQKSGELSDYQAFEHSYFYRTHTAWNKLPIKLREILDFGHFKRALRAHIWHDLWKTLLKEACDEVGATHLTDLVM